MAAILVNLDSLPDDSFSQVISAAGDIAGDYVPVFKAVRGLGCVSKGMLQQLHRVRPTVSVHSLVVVQRHCHGPWRVVLMHRGELTHAVVEQAKKYNCGRVRSIVCHALGRVPRATLAPAVAMRVVPELLGAGGSLIFLNLACVELNSTWALTFGEVALGSAALRTLRLDDCKLQGPLPELRLPALRELSLSENLLTGGLEPLQACTALQELRLQENQLTGGLTPLQGCTALQELLLHGNKLTGELEPLRGCRALQVLRLDNNQLTGGLEPLRGCTALEELSLRSNQLTGDLKPVLGLLPTLMSLNLEDNKLVPTGEESLSFRR